jgi:Leucine-rich repeat (LRR) protein
MGARAATFMPHGSLPALFASLLLVAAGEASASIPASERAALIALYNSTNGVGWTYRSGWLGASGTECSWHGVVCDGAQAHLTNLTLSSNNLRGPIPPEIGSLTALETLALCNTQLSGSMPPAIGNLTALVNLYCYNNPLSGSIPPSIGNLKNLVRPGTARTS